MPPLAFLCEMTSEKLGQNSILMKRHYPDLVSARHQYAISAFVSQTIFRGKTSGCAAKCWLFSQAVISYVLSS